MHIQVFSDQWHERKTQVIGFSNTSADEQHTGDTEESSSGHPLWLKELRKTTGPQEEWWEMGYSSLPEGMQNKEGESKV